MNYYRKKIIGKKSNLSEIIRLKFNSN